MNARERREKNILECIAWGQKNLTKLDIQETIGYNALIDYAANNLWVGQKIAREYATIAIGALRGGKKTISVFGESSSNTNPVQPKPNT